MQLHKIAPAILCVLFFCSLCVLCDLCGEKIAKLGYVERKNGHLFACMLTVNNGKMPTINDIFPIFEDEREINDRP